MIKIKNWSGLVHLEQKFDRSGEEWVFRGQPSPTFRIRSSFERACADFGVKGRKMWIVENVLLQEFKRSCHLYSSPSLPDDSDTISWLALMRHYGAPSRFVDFTYSIFMAAYFAAEVENSKPVVWAVNKTWLSRHFVNAFLSLRPGRDKLDGKELLERWAKRDGAVFDKFFLDRTSPLRLVALVNPMKMNDRLVVQQGVFLCSSDVTVSFHDVLMRLRDSEENVLKVEIIPRSARWDILARLYRAGVSRAALFPGLQGYSESLRTKILLALKLIELRRRGARVGPTGIGV